MLFNFFNHIFANISRTIFLLRYELIKTSGYKNIVVYLRISNPCVMSPEGASAKLYSCSLAINLRMQPVMPSETGSRLVKPVILPMPPRNTGSRKVIREKRPCVKKEKKLEGDIRTFWIQTYLKVYHFDGMPQLMLLLTNIRFLSNSSTFE